MSVRSVKRSSLKMNTGVIGDGCRAHFTALLAAALFVTAPLHADGGKQHQARNFTYSGQAVALRIDGVTQPVSGPIIVCDTGSLPLTGGHMEKSASNVDIAGGALTITSAAAEVSGRGSKAEAQGELKNYRVEFAVHENGHSHHAIVEADLIKAEVAAKAGGRRGVKLSSNVVVRGLKVNGRAIVVTGAPNQRVELPEEVGGWLIINEQSSASGRGDGDIGASAIHFFVCHCIEGHIGFVYCGISEKDKHGKGGDKDREEGRGQGPG